MPRRGARLLAGRTRRSAVRSMVLRCVGDRQEESKPNCAEPINHCHQSQIDVAGGVLATPSAATGAVARDHVCEIFDFISNA